MAQRKYCPSCGEENYNYSNNCSKCGSDILHVDTTEVDDPNKPLLYLNGSNGQIELFKDRVVISRQGFTAKAIYGLTKGDKSIYLNQISAIQIKEAGFSGGYIQFSLAGGNESTKGRWDAASDENSVTFASTQNDAALDIKKKIEEIKEESQKKQNAPTYIKNEVSSADEILKFKNLLDLGIITQDEFNTKKKQLLGL